MAQVNVAIVTDSTAYLPAELVRSGSVPITVVPLHIVMGGKQHREGVDVTVEDLSAALRTFTPLSTSRPPPQAFLDSYEAAAASGASHIVSIHISSAMSGTCESARLAAADSPVPVDVVDSRSLGMAMGFAVLSAAEAAASGADPATIARIARTRAAAAKVAFYVDTLEYLRRGGRIAAASALVGSAFSIKPILTLVDGTIRPLEKVRTASRALARVTELISSAANDVIASGGQVDIAVQHLDAQVRAEALAQTLRERVPGVGEVVVAELGAVVGSHAGPGTLAAVASPRPRS